MSPNVKKEDNINIKIKQEGIIALGKKNIPVYSIGGEPKQYESFDLLKGGVLEDVEGNRLRIRKDGTSMDVYIHECFDAIYLSRDPTEPNEEIMVLGADKKVKPLEELVGKEITYVEKSYFSIEDKLKDLPIALRSPLKDAHIVMK
jgi:hypothetical protein